MRMQKTGFGFLRLPRTADKSIDYAALNPMVDRFLELGGTYFDTCYTYLQGLSEEAIRKAVVQRHPRDRIIIANKLPGYQAATYDRCYPLFEESCRRCGVDYFDVYLLHWLNEKHFAIAEQCDQFRFLQELKASGKARRIGFSYHDSPQLLDRILTRHPEMDIVQLQINYLDWNSVSLQAKACYDVAVAHNKAVVIMEPVKGGSLAKLPPEAEAILRDLAPEKSMAAWAMGFAAGLEQVETVLSGMNAMEQIEDNLRPYPPLTRTELDALEQCAGIIRSATAVACTGCGYCAPHCPMQIPIPQYFALYNEYARSPGDDWKMQYAYDALTKTHGKAADCIGCGSCAAHCPQKLEIPTHLTKVSAAFKG